MKWLFLSFVLVFSGCAHRPISELKADEKNGWIYSSPEDREARIVVVPQWHLSPQTNTVYSGAGLPQTENQLSLYRQLVQWIEDGTIKTVVVEGCEGEIESGNQTRFNGWSLADLEKMTSGELDRVLTHIGLKLKARVRSQARIACGDDLELIKKHQLTLSNLRGLAGFRARIEQFKEDPVKRQDYVEGAREILKLSKETSESETVRLLSERLRSELGEFELLTQKRNAAFVRVAKFARPMAAIVIGAIHVEDLRRQLKEQNLASVTFEPRGLKGDESEVVEKLKDLLR